jgi:hypothetical protein
LTQLINPQWINNSCGKNKSQKNKSWNLLIVFGRIWIQYSKFHKVGDGGSLSFK